MIKQIIAFLKEEFTDVAALLLLIGAASMIAFVFALYKIYS